MVVLWWYKFQACELICQNEIKQYLLTVTMGRHDCMNCRLLQQARKESLHLCYEFLHIHTLKINFLSFSTGTSHNDIHCFIIIPSILYTGESLELGRLKTQRRSSNTLLSLLLLLVNSQQNL